MAGVARIGDVTTGHGLYGPQTIMTGNLKVLVGGRPIAVINSIVSLHCVGFACHYSNIASASLKVFVQGTPIVRIGDVIACGGMVATGYDKVIAN